MQIKEDCYFLTKNNGFQVVDGYGTLEWHKIFSKVKKAFYNQIKNTKIWTKKYNEL